METEANHHKKKVTEHPKIMEYRIQMGQELK